PLLPCRFQRHGRGGRAGGATAPAPAAATTSPATPPACARSVAHPILSTPPRPHDQTHTTSLLAPCAGRQLGVRPLLRGRPWAAFWPTKTVWPSPTGPVTMLSPSWPGFLADTALCTALLWASFLMLQRLIHGRRRRAGTCERCGYDLVGNTTGVCPECGTKL